MKIRIVITSVAEFDIEPGEDPADRLKEELEEFEDDQRAYTTLFANTFTASGEIIE